MNLGIIIIIGYVFMYSCSQSKDPIGVVQMKNDAHGVWEAVEGDISVVDEIGLIV